MDDGEVELSDCLFLPNSDSSSNIQASLSADSFLDDLLRNAQTCTHTHTCNPPGPDTAHTHTCYHTHTHVIPSEEDDDPCDEKSPVSKRQRPLGNREAVRKYREKKKAHAAILEEEVKKLRLLNQQLMKKLQRQAILEAEIVRLRALLLDLRGKINNELGDFPFQKFILSNGIDGCGKTMAAWETDCQPAIVDCQASRNYIQSAEKRLQDSLETLISSAPQEE
ncbi:UNVERIFIED_CONTAM: Basic leucine zipper 23 [Sesamum angustifolium]|uniref:Basic leucine zipper 23 n=1 Tax=Sesamum angustifolium TaxID=2727405 RepID=A0AAW2P1I4_9LAMI